MEFEKSAHNQEIANQHKLERKLGLPHTKQLTDVGKIELRAQRQERLKGVTLYTRDAVKEHGKGLIPEVIDCA